MVLLKCRKWSCFLLLDLDCSVMAVLGGGGACGGALLFRFQRPRSKNQVFLSLLVQQPNLYIHFFACYEL